VLVHPSIRLSILEYTTKIVTVTGEVETPGQYPLVSAMPLNVVLGRAGGIRLNSAERVFVIHSLTPSRTQEVVDLHGKDFSLQLSQITVQPGDSISVERSGIIYVMGAVNKSGGYLMVNKGRLDVYQALSLAGGMTLNADGSGLRIFRPTEGSATSYVEIRIPFSNLAKSSTEKVELRPNDVLFVPRSGLKVAFLDGAAVIGAALNSVVYKAP
jgi:polysaccharide biosynthesis/export protein